MFHRHKLITTLALCSALLTPWAAFGDGASTGGRSASVGAGNVDTATQRVVLANNSIPCTSIVAISQADDATVITGTASQYIYICSIVLVAGAAEIINILEGTGTVCGTGTAVLAGSSTQANGLSFAANGGLSAISGYPFMRTQTLADNLCLTQSGTSRVSGWISYTKAP